MVKPMTVMMVFSVRACSKCVRCSLFRGHEGGKFLVQRVGDGFFVFELEREPFASGWLPFRRQSEAVRIGGAKPNRDQNGELSCVQTRKTP